ncbi:MAG: DinB family protein [Chloroflexi bacterium]|nr:DinB family protein [Chloroflexota bacterium]
MTFNTSMLMMLDAAFYESKGYFLDRGTSVFETLAGITAEQASQPGPGGCATIAAHVAHMIYYIEFTLRFVRGDHTDPDWNHVWDTVSTVTEEEWQASQARLRAAVEDVRHQITSTTMWASEREMGGAIALLMHNAYHLGEIRRALCALNR